NKTDRNDARGIAQMMRLGAIARLSRRTGQLVDDHAAGKNPSLPAGGRTAAYDDHAGGSDINRVDLDRAEKAIDDDLKAAEKVLGTIGEMLARNCSVFPTAQGLPQADPTCAGVPPPRLRA